MKFLKSNFHRRGFLRSAGLLAASGAAGSARRMLGGQPDAAPRTLALIGDRYHNSDFIRLVLARLFKSLNLPFDFTTDYEKLSAKLLADYQLFVCFRDGMIWPNGYLGPDFFPYAGELENADDYPASQPEAWIKEDQGRAVKEFVENGGGFYALHNSSHISLSSKDYRDVMGGAFDGHPPVRPFKVRITNPDHPITRGVSDFMVTDEQHYLIYDKDPKSVIMRSENLDGLRYEKKGASAIAGWAYDYGKGRVAFTAPGHNLHSMWQPEYVKIQQNAVRWLLRMNG
jgi:type 1 glutamine amidotransferase